VEYLSNLSPADLCDKVCQLTVNRFCAESFINIILAPKTVTNTDRGYNTSTASISVASYQKRRNRTAAATTTTAKKKFTLKSTTAIAACYHLLYYCILLLSKQVKRLIPVYYLSRSPPVIHIQHQQPRQSFA
jgi:hypothetical protein